MTVKVILAKGMKSDKRNAGKFPCEICGQRFTRQDNLSVHMKNIHGNQNEGDFQCMLCEKVRVFKHKRNLSQHLKQKPHLKTKEEIKVLLSGKKSE